MIHIEASGVWGPTAVDAKLLGSIVGCAHRTIRELNEKSRRAAGHLRANGWAAVEDKLLRDNYGRVTASRISSLMFEATGKLRSPEAVRQRAYLLKLGHYGGA